jgi:hypothetical protein
MADTNPSDSENPSQEKGSKRKRKGRKPGLPNYQNNKLIRIIERILPNGSEAWRLVAMAYKEESGEAELRTEKDLKRNWLRKLCNNYKKPTGATGGIEDRVNRCIEIDRRIQRSTDSGLLGASSGEDNAGDYLSDSSSSSVEEASLQDDDQDQYDFMAEEGDEDEEQDPTADIPVASVAVHQDTTNPTPNEETNPTPNEESNTNKAGHNNARSPASSRYTPRRKSSAASKNSASSGKSGGKTKNSSNKERGSVLKTMDRIASSFENGVGDGGESVAQISMMMMMQQQSQAQMQAQMQQQQQWQQFQTMQQMQLQQFQQSMQNQLAAMDQRANKTDKILRRLVKERRTKKRKRNHERDSEMKSDSEDESSDSTSDN